MSNQYYPPSPQIERSQLTKVNNKYRIQVIINLFSIIVFFILFLGMIVGAAYLIELAIYYSIRGEFTTWYILLKVGLIGMSIMFFGFLLKFLFKNHNTENPLHVEVTEEEHPKLFQFIRQLSSEVGAPFPKRVFVNHEINAAVFYHSTVLSLFFPVKKNLLVGLGLVNSISLDEFKAVLAHEFGHFSQSSMKLGSYVYMANSMIYDMVYERDKWDELLERWKKMDGRIAIFAWILSPIIWLVRLFMMMLYQGLNLLHSSLSRQMEYHADLVAVSVSGSNSLINALYKIGLSNESYNFTLDQLQTANDQSIYSNDIFFNHRKCHDYLETNNDSFREHSFSNKVTEPESRYMLFDKDDGTGTNMYASHPSNFKREKNAKAIFVEGVIDSRSAWQLFDKPDQLAQRVTENLYKISLNDEKIRFLSKREAQDFIANELSDTTYDPRYKNFYSQRTLNVPKHEDYELLLKKHNISSDSIKDDLAGLWDLSFSNYMETVLKKNEKFFEIINLSQSNDKKATVEINGNYYKLKELEKAHQDFNEWIQEDNLWFEKKSEQISTVYTFLNKKIKPNDTELQLRYTFMASVNALSEKVNDIQNALENGIQELIDKGQIEDAEISIYADRFFKQKLALEDVARQANTVSMPNMGQSGRIEKLGEYLTRGQVTYLPIKNIDYDRIQVFQEQVQVVSDRLNRLGDKNLGFLLKYQELLESEFSETQ